MKKIIDSLFCFTYKTVLIFSIICLSIALIGATFFCVNRSYDYLNPLVLIIGTIIFLFCIMKIYKYIIKLSEKKIRIICLVLLFSQFILLFVSTRIIRSIPQVDLIHMLTGINSLKDIGSIVNNEYFSVYPNNKFLFLILYGIRNLFQDNFEIIIYLFSSLCITIMSLFTYKTIKKISDSKKALVGLIICVFSPIFYLYVSYYYTDVIMLCFASVLLYFIIKNCNERKGKKEFITNIFIGILAAVSYKIRAVSIFLLIAFFVYLIIKKEFKLLLKKIIPILGGLVLTIFVINNIENKVFHDVDKNKEFPMTHWIMMGVNLENFGYYSQDDYNLSYNTDNKNERKNLNIKTIGSRLKSQGFFGNLTLSMIKIVSVWGKGDYSYQKYLDLVDEYNFSYEYLLEEKNIAINYILQVFKIGILVLAIMSLIYLYKTNKKSIIAIAIFGAILFYLMWEVCPRYGLSFLPWLIILSTYSYDKVNIISKVFISKKFIKYVILFVTLLLFIFGFFKYTNISYKENIISKDTSNRMLYFELNNKTIIKQSIVSQDSFNLIKLKFSFEDDISKENIYTLEVLDALEDIKYQKSFTVEELENKKYTTFKLDKDYEKGIYYIKLSTNSLDSLNVALSYKEYFDLYPLGNLTINDNLQDGDLMFEIINSGKKRIYSYFEYIILMILTIGLEYILFFRKKEL